MSMTGKVMSAALLFACFQAHAATDATLEVSGRLVPHACSIHLGNGGTFDFGEINASDIHRDQTTLLTPLETNLRVDCDGPAEFMLMFEDQRSASAVPLPIPSYEGVTTFPAQVSFGLGTAQAGRNIGAFMAEFDRRTMVADSAPTKIIYEGVLSGGVWQSVDGVNNARIVKGTRMYAFSNTDSPEFIEHVSGTFRISVGIAHDQGLTFGDRVEFDGAAVIHLDYL